VNNVLTLHVPQNHISRPLPDRAPRCFCFAQPGAEGPPENRRCACRVFTDGDPRFPKPKRTRKTVPLFAILRDCPPAAARSSPRPSFFHARNGRTKSKFGELTRERTTHGLGGWPEPAQRGTRAPGRPPGRTVGRRIGSVTGVPKKSAERIRPTQWPAIPSFLPGGWGNRPAMPGRKDLSWHGNSGPFRRND